MTTTTTSRRKVREFHFEPGQECTIGTPMIHVTCMRITSGGHSWGLYTTPTDEWWEDCDECDDSPGYCISCGGARIIRVAGGKGGMLTVLRHRVDVAEGTLGMTGRHQERDREAAREYCAAHPNLASDLARERAFARLGRNDLAGIALSLTRAPLTPKQERYAVSLLSLRAWEEAYAVVRRNDGTSNDGTTPPNDGSSDGTTASVVPSFGGVVGERLSLRGRLVVKHLLPLRRNDGTATVLLVVNDGRTTVRTVTTAEWVSDVRRNDVVTIDGVVRGHRSDEFGKTTIISHPRLMRHPERMNA